MQTKGIVADLLPSGYALVTVIRGTACGHNCVKCGGCGPISQEISVRARNGCNARIGDTVNVHTSTRKVLSLAALLYFCPVLLFIAGYLIVPWLGFAAFAVSLSAVVLYGALCLPRRRCGTWLSF